MEYLQQAAEAGHRAAMIELAKHLDTGSSAVRYATNSRIFLNRQLATILTNTDTDQRSTQVFLVRSQQ